MAYFTVQSDMVADPTSADAARLAPARLAAVRATGLLDSEIEESFDRLTRLAVRLVGVSSAFISLVDENRDFYKSACGFGEALTTSRELSGPTFCHYTLQSTEPLVIPDTAADPMYADVPTVRTLGVAAYVGVPLVVQGEVIGAFCAIELWPRAWSTFDVTTLTELASIAVSEIELRAANRRSEEARLEVEALNIELHERAALLEAQSEELRAMAQELAASESRYRTLVESGR